MVHGGNRILAAKRARTYAPACQKLLTRRTFILMFFKNIQRVTVMVFHADSTKYGAHRTRCAPLFTDDLANVTWSHTKFKHSALISFYGFHDYCSWVIHKSLRDLCD